MRNSIALSLVGVLFASVAFADHAEDAKPPEPGVVSPTPASDGKNPFCGPIGYGRVDRDLAPGRGERVTGGMLIGLGIATLVPGAVLLRWSFSDDRNVGQPVDNLHEIKVASGIATGLGVASVIAGIPVLAVGIHNGKKAREERVTLRPSLVPRLGGASAMVGGTF